MKITIKGSETVYYHREIDLSEDAVAELKKRLALENAYAVLIDYIDVQTHATEP